MKVINGGVFGYGVDQTYLRMLQLVEISTPDLIIFSFIKADIGRCNFSERLSIPKPYFEIGEMGQLTLFSDHVKEFSPSQNTLDNTRLILGYSYFMHLYMSHAYPEYWLHGSLLKNKYIRGEKKSHAVSSNGFLLFSATAIFQYMYWFNTGWMDRNTYLRT